MASRFSLSPHHPVTPSPRSGRRGTRTPKRTMPPPVFETGSSSGRMPSVVVCHVPFSPTSPHCTPSSVVAFARKRLRGLESNQHQDVQSVPSYR